MQVSKVLACRDCERRLIVRLFGDYLLVVLRVPGRSLGHGAKFLA